MFESLHIESQPPTSSNGANGGASSSNGKPVLTVCTQMANERDYILAKYPPDQLAECRHRWVSGATGDCWVSVGDVVARLDGLPGVVLEKNKVFVDTGRRRGQVPVNVLGPFSQHEHKSSNSSNSTTGGGIVARSDSLMARNLIEFEQEVLGLAQHGDTTAAESDSFSEGELTTGEESALAVIEDVKEDEEEQAVAQYDFKGRSDGELTIVENEILLILARADMDGNAEWFKVQNKMGKCGYVPSSYLASTAS